MLLRYFLLSSITKFQAHTYVRTYQLTHVYLYAVLCKKSFFQLREPSQTVREGSFARNVRTNFKLRAPMGCVIINYVTSTQIANLLHKSPVCESVREPVHDLFHAPWVSSWFIRFHASWTYALTYVRTCKYSEAYESQTNSWGMNWFMNWLMTWFMNW